MLGETNKNTLYVIIEDAEGDDNWAKLTAMFKQRADIIISAAGAYPSRKVETTQKTVDSLASLHDEFKKPELIEGTPSTKWGEILNFEGLEHKEFKEIDSKHPKFSPRPIPLVISIPAFTSLVKALSQSVDRKVHIAVLTEMTDLKLAIEFAKNPENVVFYVESLVENAESDETDKECKELAKAKYKALAAQMRQIVGTNPQFDLKNVELFYTGSANTRASHGYLSDPKSELADQEKKWELTALFSTTEYHQAIGSSETPGYARRLAVQAAIRDLATDFGKVIAYENFGSTGGLNTTLDYFQSLQSWLHDKKHGDAIQLLLNHSKAWDNRGVINFSDKLIQNALMPLAKLNDISDADIKDALGDFENIKTDFLENNENKIPQEFVKMKICSILERLGITLNNLNKVYSMSNFSYSKGEFGQAVSDEKKQEFRTACRSFDGKFNAFVNMLRGPQFCLADVLGMLLYQLYLDGELPEACLRPAKYEWKEGPEAWPQYEKAEEDTNLQFFRVLGEDLTETDEKAAKEKVTKMLQQAINYANGASPKEDTSPQGISAFFNTSSPGSSSSGDLPSTSTPTFS